MATNVGDIYSEIAADLSQYQKGLAEAERLGDSFSARGVKVPVTYEAVKGPSGERDKAGRFVRGQYDAMDEGIRQMETVMRNNVNNWLRAGGQVETQYGKITSQLNQINQMSTASGAMMSRGAGVSRAELPGVSTASISNVNQYLAASNRGADELSGKMHNMAFGLSRLTRGWDESSMAVYRTSNAMGSILGSFEKTAQLAGAASAIMVGWTVGRLIGEVTGLDEAMQGLFATIDRHRGVGVMDLEERGIVEAGRRARQRRAEAMIATGERPFSEADAAKDPEIRKLNARADAQKEYLKEKKRFDEMQFEARVSAAPMKKDELELLMGRQMDMQLELIKARERYAKTGAKEGSADITRQEQELLTIANRIADVRKSGAEELKRNKDQERDLEEELFWMSEQEAENKARAAREAQQKSFSFTDAAGLQRVAQTMSGQVREDRGPTVAERRADERRLKMVESLDSIKRSAENWSVFR